MKLEQKRMRLAILVITVVGIGAIMPITFASAETAGNVHGTILDIDGNPLDDVKITAVLSNGDTEGPFFTDENGYFRLWLWGTYTITFEKEGYVTTQRNIQVEQSPKYDPTEDLVLGEIIFEETLSLTSHVIKRSTTPGNQLELEFTITNNGQVTENVLLSTTVPDDWDVTILDEIGEIENILLETGSNDYTIEITVPETSTNVKVITVTATGTSIATLDFTITPKVYTDEVELKSTYLSVSEEKNQDIELPLTVSNYADVDREVTLSGDIPSGWDIAFRTSTGMTVNTLLLSAGQSESLTIELETPDAVNVDDYELYIRAEAPSGELLDSLTLEVDLVESTSEVKVISTFSDVTIEAGSSVEFPLVLWNQGGSDTLFLLSVEGVSDTWDTVFVTDDVEVSSVLVGAGESTMLQFIVDPPSSVQTGDYSLTVFIESDNEFHEEMPLSITVEGNYELELVLSTLYTTTNIGDTTTYTAQVTNQGQTPVTTLYIDTFLPEDWEATITPNQLDSLDPRDTVTFTIIAEVPSDTSAGDYLITMQASSDQLESDEIDIRITAQTSNTWGYVGIGLAVVAIAGAVLVFRTFKRR